MGPSIEYSSLALQCMSIVFLVFLPTAAKASIYTCSNKRTVLYSNNLLIERTDETSSRDFCTNTKGSQLSAMQVNSNKELQRCLLQAGRFLQPQPRERIGEPPDVWTQTKCMNTFQSQVGGTWSESQTCSAQQYTLCIRGEICCFSAYT